MFQLSSSGPTLSDRRISRPSSPGNTWKHRPGRPRNSWLDLVQQLLLICGEGRFLVVMVLERRDGPRRPRGPDDDDSLLNRITQQFFWCVGTPLAH